MGGYARFVWPAYAAALLLLGGMAIWVWRTARRQRRQWAALERARPARRRP